MDRRQNFQTASWFWDLKQRRLLNLEPPYQRRSVWNQAYKDHFVDTVLLGYPSPAIFLYEEISPEGRAVYNVVDGKQRLTTVFEFADGAFPVGDLAEADRLRGLYFAQLDDKTKKAFWSYQFLVEYLSSIDDGVITSVFNRINKNVAKLTRQELRHARFDGEFITVAEALTEWTTSTLPEGFPRIVTQSRKQMKDVEFTAQLLLLLEEGPKGFSQDELDDAFSLRDQGWQRRAEIEDAFRRVVDSINSLVTSPTGAGLEESRLRNQADFYSLFGAVSALRVDGIEIEADQMAERMRAFANRVDADAGQGADALAADYYQAARSASNDKGPREKRIAILRGVLTGEGL